MNKSRTFKDKQKEEENSRCFVDRQNTLWSKQITKNCDHDWKPLTINMKNGAQPDLTNARVYCVCMKCCSYTYIETGWVGYYIGSPDLLEEAMVEDEAENR